MTKSSWRHVRLGDYFRIEHGYAFKSENFTDNGDHIVLTPGNFLPEGGLKLKGDKEKYHKGAFPKEYLLEKGDLLVVMTDLKQNAPILGSAAFIPERDQFLHNQRLGKVIELDEEELDERFLFYLFNFREVREQLKATATGATVKHTAPDRIYAVEVDIPPVSTQRKIAAILSAYDDLLENNTRRIAILEEMAQLIYREWFVHFRFPGHEDVQMVDSELGPVPEGWEVVQLIDLYNTSSGGTPSRQVDSYFGGNVAWVKTRELNDQYIIETEEKLSDAGLKNSSAKLFPKNTVLIAMYGATIGKLGILSQPAATNQACCAVLKQEEPFTHLFAFRNMSTSLRHFSLKISEQFIAR